MPDTESEPAKSTIIERASKIALPVLGAAVPLVSQYARDELFWWLTIAGTLALGGLAVWFRVAKQTPTIELPPGVDRAWVGYRRFSNRWVWSAGTGAVLTVFIGVALRFAYRDEVYPLAKIEQCDGSHWRLIEVHEKDGLHRRSLVLKTTISTRALLGPVAAGAESRKEMPLGRPRPTKVDSGVVTDLPQPPPAVIGADTDAPKPPSVVLPGETTGRANLAEPEDRNHPYAAVVTTLSRQATGKVRIDSVKLLVEPKPLPPGQVFEIPTAYRPPNETPPNTYVARLEPGKTEVQAVLFNRGVPSFGYAFLDDNTPATRLFVSLAGSGGPYEVKVQVTLKTPDGKRSQILTSSDWIWVLP